jgi:hypothetical protein
LRKDYDCEVQWMFLEIQRVKQDLHEMKSSNAPNLKQTPQRLTNSWLVLERQGVKDTLQINKV